MQKLEDQAEKDGITKLKLMERAGYGLYHQIIKKYDLKDKKLLVVAGHGNNGGDGLVLVRYLLENGYKVKVDFIGEEKKLKKEAGYNYWFLKEKDASVFRGEDIKKYDYIVDAMLGIGVTGKIREPVAGMIDRINDSGSKVISVDIPTGLNPDTGQFEKVVDADLIVTFHDIKPGLMKFKDRVVVVDIGL